MCKRNGISIRGIFTLKEKELNGFCLTFYWTIEYTQKNAQIMSVKLNGLSQSEHTCVTSAL